MFDFQFGGIEFGLVTAQNADSCAGTGEPQGESLTNSPACASNEDGYVVQAQISILSPAVLRRYAPAIPFRPLSRDGGRAADGEILPARRHIAKQRRHCYRPIPAGRR
jgi:hypothetical protein